MVLEVPPVLLVEQRAEPRPSPPRFGLELQLRDRLERAHRHQAKHHPCVQLHPWGGLAEPLEEAWGEDREPCVTVHLGRAGGGARAVLLEGAVGGFGEDDVDVGLVSLAARRGETWRSRGWKQC